MKRIASIAAVLLGAATASADARPVPASQWDTGTQLTLAQVMVGEADWHEPDHIAIAYVLMRRWEHHRRARGPITFKRYMQLYSSTMKVDTERARWVRALPWGKLEGPLEDRWSKVIALVKAFGAGKVEDPCPEAEHWGGAMDRPGRRWQPVSCGMTKNIFYGAREKNLATRPADEEKSAKQAELPAKGRKASKAKAAARTDEGRDTEAKRDVRAEATRAVEPKRYGAEERAQNEVASR